MAADAPLYYRLVLGLHVAGGALGLVGGPLALALAKGGLGHRRAGRVFYAGMLLAGATSLWLGYYRHAPFFVVIGIFSLYLTLTGRRALAWRNQTVSTGADKGLMAAMALTGLGMASYGLAQALGAQAWQGWVLVVFGLVGLGNVYSDYRVRLRSRGGPQGPLRVHLSKMLGATIAGYTAFGVNNAALMGALPPLAVWLGPTVWGSIAIAYWLRRVEARGRSV